MSKLINLLEEVAKIDPQVHQVFLLDNELFPGIKGTALKITIERGLSRNQFFLQLNHPGLKVRIMDLPDILDSDSLTLKWVGEKLHHASWGDIELHFVE